MAAGGQVEPNRTDNLHDVASLEKGRQAAAVAEPTLPRGEFHVAQKPSKVAALAEGPLKEAVQACEKAKARVRARALVEHSFQIVKRRFGYPPPRIQTFDT